jgi:hypothetical protein
MDDKRKGTMDKEIEAHKVFVESTEAYIDECLTMGVNPEQILESFEKHIDKVLDKRAKEYEKQFDPEGEIHDDR